MKQHRRHQYHEYKLVELDLQDESEFCSKPMDKLKEVDIADPRKIRIIDIHLPTTEESTLIFFLLGKLH